MARAKLSIRLPEDLWIAGVTGRHPESLFQVLAAMPSEGTGIALVEISGPEPAAVVEDMRNQEAILSLRVLEASEHRALVQFETSRPLLLLSVREAGVPLELPVEVRDGTVSLEVTASRDRLSALGSTLDGFGMSYDVEYIHHTIDTTDLLTDRQRELVTAAVEAGYYDTPRTCSLTGLADEVGSAKSTVSETLHRAEEKIIKQYVEELVASIEPE